MSFRLLVVSVGLALVPALLAACSASATPTVASGASVPASGAASSTDVPSPLPSLPDTPTAILTTPSPGPTPVPPPPLPAPASPTTVPIAPNSTTLPSLSLEFVLDKPAYTLGDDIHAAITVRNTWDIPFELPGFPAGVKLEKVGSSSSWDIVGPRRSGQAINMTPGAQTWAALTVPGSLTATVEEGSYRLVVEVLLGASPERTNTEWTFASPAFVVSSAPTPLADDPWPDLRAYTVPGESVLAYVGEEFVVGQLRYAPRLGQHWYETHDADMLALVKATDVAPPSTLGAATWYRFKPLKPGTSRISLVLRTADDRPPLDQTSFEVTTIAQYQSKGG